MRLISPSQQRGFTLVEVLVTLVIFAIGMLGVAGLQITALTGMDAAQYRSVATLKANEMAERVRANPGTSYDKLVGADGSCRATHYADTHAAPVACTAANLAKDDVADWNAELAARLPTGTGIVCIDSTPDDGTATLAACDGVGRGIAIKVWWTEKARVAGSVPEKRLALVMVP